MRSRIAVVAPAWCTTNVVGGGDREIGRRREWPDTLLGFETTSPQSRISGFGERVVAPSLVVGCGV